MFQVDMRNHDVTLWIENMLRSIYLNHHLVSHPVHKDYPMHLRNCFSFLLDSLLTLYGIIETEIRRDLKVI